MGARENPNKASASTTLSNWRFWDQHVQNDMPGGNFINAATVLVAAGPPRLSDTGKTITSDEGLNLSTADGPDVNSSPNMAYPIGVIENFGMQQNRVVQELFESGSKHPVLGSVPDACDVCVLPDCQDEGLEQAG